MVRRPYPRAGERARGPGRDHLPRWGLDRIRADLVAFGCRSDSMGALSLATTGLIALLGSAAPGGNSTLEHVAPATLEARAGSVRVPDSSLGSAWAIHGSTLA